MRNFLFLMLFLNSLCFALSDQYEFSSSEEKQQFSSLSHELRCLVCQNQTIADSNAPLAKDLRLQIYQQLKTGHSPEQIREYMISRYGDFILYKPPVTRYTLGLWFGPFFLLLISIAFLLLYIRRQKK